MGEFLTFVHSCLDHIELTSVVYRLGEPGPPGTYIPPGLQVKTPPWGKIARGGREGGVKFRLVSCLSYCIRMLSRGVQAVWLIGGGQGGCNCVRELERVNRYVTQGGGRGGRGEPTYCMDMGERG